MNTFWLDRLNHHPEYSAEHTLQWITRHWLPNSIAIVQRCRRLRKVTALSNRIQIRFLIMLSNHISNHSSCAILVGYFWPIFLVAFLVMRLPNIFIAIAIADHNQFICFKEHTFWTGVANLKLRLQQAAKLWVLRFLKRSTAIDGLNFESCTWTAIFNKQKPANRSISWRPLCKKGVVQRHCLLTAVCEVYDEISAT